MPSGEGGQGRDSFALVGARRGWVGTAVIHVPSRGRVNPVIAMGAATLPNFRFFITDIGVFA